MQKITTCLWFDTQAEEAAHFYTSLFDNSRIVEVQHYTDAVPDRAGQVMLVVFELDGQRFMALNGGPEFPPPKPPPCTWTAPTRTKSTACGPASPTAARSRSAAG